MKYELQVDVDDPWVNLKEVLVEYVIEICSVPPKNIYSEVVMAVEHNEFLRLNAKSYSPNGVVIDVKGFLPREMVDS